VIDSHKHVGPSLYWLFSGSERYLLDTWEPFLVETWPEDASISAWLRERDITHVFVDKNFSYVLKERACERTSCEVISRVQKRSELLNEDASIAKETDQWILYAL